MRGAAVPSQQLGGGDGGEELQLQAVRIARFTFHFASVSTSHAGNNKECV